MVVLVAQIFVFTEKLTTHFSSIKRRFEMPKKQRYHSGVGGGGGGYHASGGGKGGRRQKEEAPSTFRNQKLTPVQTIKQTKTTLKRLKKDGTFDSIRSRLVNAILQNETLKTYASFAVTASTQMMRLRNMNTTASEKVNAQTKMAIKRELELDLSREVSNACWNELAEKDGDIARAVQKEIFRERKMRYDLKEEKILKRKKMKKTKKVGGRLARGGR